ncbi:MAG: hypothetical protein JSV86_05935 [Gemmatimonadota bacterium]|nr:MAG: hypothetical protein JSV86_05935 [Gemmatimonadota bacterium]
MRVRGRRGSSAFRPDGAGNPDRYWENVAGGGPPGATTMWRLAVIRRYRDSGTAIQPLWTRESGLDGWHLWLGVGSVIGAQVGTGVGVATATGSVEIQIGPLYTIGFTVDTIGVQQIRGFVNGQPDGSAAVVAYSAGAPNHEVGAISGNPFAADQLEVYALLAGDNEWLSNAQMLTLHNQVVDNLEQGRALTALTAGQIRCWDGRSCGEILSPTGLLRWVDEQAADPLTATSVRPPDLVYRSVRF